MTQQHSYVRKQAIYGTGTFVPERWSMAYCIINPSSNMSLDVCRHFASLASYWRNAASVRTVTGNALLSNSYVSIFRRYLGYVSFSIEIIARQIIVSGWHSNPSSVLRLVMSVKRVIYGKQVFWSTRPLTSYNSIMPVCCKHLGWVWSVR